MTLFFLVTIVLASPNSLLGVLSGVKQLLVLLVFLTAYILFYEIKCSYSVLSNLVWFIRVLLVYAFALMFYVLVISYGPSSFLIALWTFCRTFHTY